MIHPAATPLSKPWNDGLEQTLAPLDCAFWAVTEEGPFLVRYDPHDPSGSAFSHEHDRDRYILDTEILAWTHQDSGVCPKAAHARWLREMGFDDAPERFADVLALESAIETARDELRSARASAPERRLARIVFERLSQVKHDLGGPTSA